MEQENKFIIFLCAGIVMIVLDSLLMVSIKNVKLKSKAHTVTLVLSGILFVLFIDWIFLLPARVLVFMACAVAVIVALMVRFTKFCDSCADMIYIPQFTKIRYCPRCGSKM